jgi:hypothetical protein
MYSLKENYEFFYLTCVSYDVFKFEGSNKMKVWCS